MDLVAGIDVGSKTTKAVVLDGDQKVRGESMVRTQIDFPAVARDALDKALAQVEPSHRSVNYIATTGFGRYNVPFRDVQITDITSVARGAIFLFPTANCVLDIGAQSTRAIKVLPSGKVKDFRTNDKCAAGAGGFIERAARYLEIPIEDVGELSMNADQPKTISSVCAVLAESEIINHVSAGETVENIMRGVHNSLASRALSLLRRVGIEDEITFVGGVARQAGMVAALQETLKKKVNVSEKPYMVGALGAALLALNRLQKIQREQDERAASAPQETAV